MTKHKNDEYLWASASAISTCDPVEDGCERKWYAQKILKVPEPPRTATTFGDVIHNVLERFQDADENGRDPETGQPMELYPEGWEYPVNKFTGEREKESVSVEEQAIIKLLVATAIENGMLVRLPGRKTEEKIERWNIMPGVMITGFIDLLQEDAIEDHKSCKTMTYCLSKRKGTKKYLGSNIQLMLYAYWMYTENGYSKDERLLIRHNYYCHMDMGRKGDPHVEPREAYVTWKEVDIFWTSRIKPILERMKELKKLGPKFLEIPMPMDTEKSCRKYTGCHLIKVCNGFESLEDYKKRMSNEDTSETESQEYSKLASKLGDKDMSESPVMRKLRLAREAKQAAEGGGAPATEKEAPASTPAEKPAETPVEKAATETTTETTSAQGKTAAPWYQDGCATCSSSDVPGIRPDGTGPCQICVMRSRKAKGPVPDDFEWEVGDGTVMFVSKETGEEVCKQTVAEDASFKESPATDAPETAKEDPAEEVPAKKEEPAPPEQKKAVEPIGPKTEDSTLFAGAGIVTEREKFELIIEASIVEAKAKGGGKLGSPSCVITGEELHAMVRTHLSAVVGTAGGPSGWHGIDPWKRKDAIMMYGREIAELCGSSTVIFGRVCRSSELETIIQAIRPYARRVIQALAG